MQKIVKLLPLLLISALISCQSPTPPERANLKNNPLVTEILQQLPPAGKVQQQPTPGAPQSITRNIIQDNNGDIWLATFEGIIKYDGNTFTNITKEVSSSRFFAVHQDSNEDFWFGSIGDGLYHYDGTKFTPFSQEEGLVSDKITNIYEDQAGVLWFGGVEGITRYDGYDFQNFTEDHGLCDDDVNDITEDKNGDYWIGTRGLACIYDGKSFRTITTASGKTFSNVRHIIRDQHDNMWLGGSDGLWRFDGEQFTQITKRFTGHIIEDSKGNIWTSAESITSIQWALRRYNAATVNSQEPAWEELMAGEGMFFGILEEDSGKIWAGTLQGAYHYDGTAFTDFKYTSDQKE